MLGQIVIENLALSAGQKKVGQNEAGQIKGRPKLGQLKFLLKIIGHVRMYVYGINNDV